MALPKIAFRLPKSKWLFFVVVFLLVVITFTLVYFNFFQKGQYACPVPQAYCRTGEVVELGGEYYGIGYKLPSETDFYSLIDGQYMTSGGTKFVEDFETVYPLVYVYEKNPAQTEEKSKVVIYTLSDRQFNLALNIEKGAKIGQVNDQPIEPLGDYNLVVKLIDESSGERKTIELKPGDLK